MSCARANSTTRSKKPVGHDRAGRVVRVVEVHQLRPLGDVVVDRVEVGHEAELGLERHQHRLGAGEPRAAGVDGVAGVGGERVVARVQEGEVEVEDRLLGADRRDDLAARGRASRRSGARRSRAPPARKSSRPRLVGYWWVSGSVTASCIASTISGGVGRSGSPMPRLITSTPAARFAAILRSSWANAYGGMRSRRLLGLMQLLFEVLAEVPANTGRAQPVRVTCRSSPTSTSSSPPSSETTTVAVRAPRLLILGVGDGGAARAGPRGQRLPHPALEDPRADAGRLAALRACELGVPGHVGAVGEARVASIAGPIAAEVERRRAPPRSRRGSRTGGCRSRRGGSPTRGRRRSSCAAPVRRPAGEVRRSARLARPMSTEHVSGPGDRRADPAGGGADRELVAVGPAAAAQVQDRLARAVARQLGLRAVGVEDPQVGHVLRARPARRAAGRRRRTDAEVGVAEPAHARRA